MRGLIVFAILVGLIYTVHAIDVMNFHAYGDEAIMVLGFVLLCSWLAGRLTARLRMPMINGYLLAGLFFGPYVLGALSARLSLFSPATIEQLSLIDGLALGIIAFTAGGELRLRELRARLKNILAVTLFQSLIVFTGVFGLLLILAPHLPLTAGRPMPFMIAVAMLLGMSAVAKSPATTIAVITEMNARGRLTTLMLSVTMLKDVIVLILFSVGVILARMLIAPEGGFDVHTLLLIAWEVIGSLLIGVLVGLALSLYIKYVGRELPILVLTVSYLATYLGEAAHLSGILVCMAAGFTVENFSAHGERLIAAIEKYSLPIFIVFFTVAGAKINVPALRAMGVVALLLVGSRLLFTFLGTYVGSRLSGGDRHERRLGWMGFIGQAGVTLSLALIIERIIPDIGGQLSTLIIAAIAVNQIIGPILLRFALVRSGEAGAGK
ncbi:MAG TPA: cation:proton antiporter [bacterium]|nr:cation:proton antiporter [bacterium]